MMHRRAAIGPSTPVGTPWRRGMFQAVKRGAIDNDDVELLFLCSLNHAYHTALQPFALVG